MGQDAISLVIRTLGELYVFIVIMRFMLQLANADYYNPISQAVVRITQAPISILQKVLPRIGRVDLASLMLAFLVKVIILAVIFTLAGIALHPLPVVIYALAGTLYALLNVYFYAVLASVIISWIAPDSYHPAPQLIQQVTQPLYSAVGKVIPPLGGFDLSPIFIFLAIQLIQAPLRQFVI